MTFQEFVKSFNPFREAADGNHWGFFESAKIEFHLPKFFEFTLFGQQFEVGLSKFMILQLIAAGIILALFVPACRRIAKGDVPKGRLTNAVEALLLFLRDQVAYPTIGEKDSKRFMPFLWSAFVFILVMNLLGMVPFMGSATASLAVTGVLALIAFFVIHVNGIKAAHGFGKYLHHFQVKIDRDDAMMKILAPIIEFLVFGLEVMGAFIRGIVLAVRLFANMLAGHTAMFVLLSFIPMIGVAVQAGQAHEGWFWVITPISVIAVTLLGMLELFVAFLQAFVFVFLTSTFLGAALHPEH
ncbi:MAG: F0F1 ATP synthase subunit A [Zavarzinella sp.]